MPTFRNILGTGAEVYAFPQLTDRLLFETAAGAPRVVDADDIGGMLDIRSFGAVGNGVASDTVAVQAALDAIQGVTQSGAYLGRTLWVPKGTGNYMLPSWGAYFQSGPIRIRAEQGATFDGLAINDWLNNPVPEQNPGTAINPPLNAFRFLRMQQIGAANSAGPPIDIEGLTFFRWTHVFRQEAASHSNVIPLFRLSRCRFEECFRGVGMFLDATAMYDRIEITYNTFYKCNVGVSWEGSRWQNVLVHGNYADFCTREGFRFGSNTTAASAFWNRIIFSFNCITRIGLAPILDAGLGQDTTNEVHALRDYSQYALYLGNMCYQTDAGTNSNDAEMIYTKARWASLINNILVSPDGRGDSRALFAKKGQPRTWALQVPPDGPDQTKAFSSIFSTNIFHFQTIAGTATFSESGDYILSNNWFENCGEVGGQVLMHGSSEVGNLDQVIVIRDNVFRYCHGWLVTGPIKGGELYFEDNVINSGLLAAERHLGIITMPGMGATPTNTVNYGAVNLTLYIRRNSGDAGTQAGVHCRHDAGPFELSAIVEGNSLVVPTGATWHLVTTANGAMLRIDIINNDLNGSSNTARLIDISNSNLAPKQLRIRGNRGLRRTTTTATAVVVQQLLLPAAAVGVIRYKLIGRNSTTSVDAYYGEIYQGIFQGTGGLFGTNGTSTPIVFELTRGLLTAGRASITSTGTNVDIRIVPPAGTTSFTWDVDIDAFYEAP